MLLTILTASCAANRPIVAPCPEPIRVEIPDRPYMEPVEWQKCGDKMRCLDAAGARKLLTNIVRLRAHIEALENLLK